MSAMQWAAYENAIQQWLVTGSGLASDHVTWAQQTAPRPTGPFISMRLDGITGSDWDWQVRVDNILAVAVTTITGVNTSTGALTIPAHGLVTGDGQLQFITTGTLPGGLAVVTNYWAVVVDANTIKVAASFVSAMAVVPVTLALSSSGTGSSSVTGTSTTVRAGQEIIQYTRGPRQARLHLQCFAGAPTGGAPTGVTSPLAVLHDALSAHALESVNAILVTAGVGVAGWDPIRSVDGIVNTTRFEPRAMTTVRLHFASEIVETSTYIQTADLTGTTVGATTIVVALP